MGDKQDGAARLFPSYRLSLGLDLRGGSYLLLETDVQAYIKERVAGLGEDVKKTLREARPNGKRILYSRFTRQESGVSVALKDPAQGDAARQVLRKLSRDLDVTLDESKLSARFSDQALTEMRRQVMEQTVEIVRRRVDETGTREPDIQRQGENRILLQVPGLQDPGRLKELLGKTAKLSFHEVRDNDGGALPSGYLRLPYAAAEDAGRTVDVKRSIMIGGEHLADAQAGFDQYNRPVVNIHFDQIGAKQFSDATKELLGKPFAIVLDGKVLTAPVVRAVIIDGRAEISGSFTTAEANDLSVLLRAGALPAPIEVVEERTVGPSLGKDSIDAGVIAIQVAFAAVVILMIANYRKLGIFAAVALLVNLAMIIAVMTILGATLTLPGIAGILLTTGMAVDANVLIFEHIREERYAGKKMAASVKDGFDQALSSIVDANVTTLIAAVLLYMFGSGPIKGFAVTLSVGILASMFSALMLTQTQITSWMALRRPKQLFDENNRKAA